MLNLNDIEIKMKKYDRIKNTVIANIVIFDQIEIRGFILRYTETKFSPNSPVWVVAPPSVKGRNKKWFWIIRIKDSLLWQELQKELISETENYVEKTV